MGGKERLCVRESACFCLIGVCIVGAGSLALYPTSCYQLEYSECTQKSQILFFWTDTVFFQTLIMRSSECVKTNIKNFINKRPTFYVIYFLLQHKNWKRWTQFLFININHYVCLWLILSCKIDMLLTADSHSLLRSIIFKKYKWEICKKEITMQWLKINFFFPSWKQLILKLFSFLCWRWWGHYHLNQQRKLNSFQWLCCFGCYPVEQEEH